MRNKETKAPDKIVDFMPDALEIKHQKLPLAISLGVWIPFIVLVFAIVWATWAKTDVVVRGEGKLVTDSPVIVMKPLERSIIKKVNVKIGDTVKKDQILITFDPAINQAEAERIKNEIHALEVQFARLKAEFQGELYTGGTAQFAKWQLAMAKLLLENSAARARQIIAEFQPQFASVKEYLDYMDSLNCEGDRIRTLDDGTLAVKI